MTDKTVCQDCEIEGHSQWHYGWRHCGCANTCDRMVPLEWMSDHQADQQKLLQQISAGSDPEICTSATGEVVAMGDPPHTIKIYRSNLYWWYLYDCDWLVSIMILRALLDDPDRNISVEARRAGLTLSLLRNRDRQSVETVTDTANLAPYLRKLESPIVTHTVVPAKVFWRTNQPDSCSAPIDIAIRISDSLILMLDQEKAQVFRLRSHQPFDKYD